MAPLLPLPGRGFAALPSGGNTITPTSWAGYDFRPFHGRDVLRPPFLFSREKKETCRARCKEKRAFSSFRRLGLLLIDGSLIITGVAIWKCFRMRSHISAADAHGAMHSQTAENALFFTVQFARQKRFAYGAVAERENKPIRKMLPIS